MADLYKVAVVLTSKSIKEYSNICLFQIDGAGALVLEDTTRKVTCYNRSAWVSIEAILEVQDVNK